MPVSEDDFRRTLSHFASGVSVVTTRDAKGRAHGITVSAFCSVSLNPPLVLICIERATASHYAFRESGVFVVNILDSTQQDLSERFAAPDEDKFGNVEFATGLDDVPVLKSALAKIECRLTRAVDGGDHSIFIGSVEHVTYRDGEPLIYFRSDYR